MGAPVVVVRGCEVEDPKLSAEARDISLALEEAGPDDLEGARERCREFVQRVQRNWGSLRTPSAIGVRRVAAVRVAWGDGGVGGDGGGGDGDGIGGGGGGDSGDMTEATEVTVELAKVAEVAEDLKPPLKRIALL